MRILVATADPAGTDPEGAVSRLRVLSCDVVASGFDLQEISEAALATRPPAALVVEAVSRTATAAACLRGLRAIPALAEVPSLAWVAPQSLPALPAGFDDFVLASASRAEIAARLRRLLRPGAEESIQVGPLAIDGPGYVASAAGRKLPLTRREFELLRFLARHPGKVFTRDQLLARVWGYRYSGGARTVDIHVRRLRAALGTQNAALVATVRNVGYKLDAKGKA